jgi:hypothetical protein
MPLLAILLVRARTDCCAGVGSPLAGDHRSQATFLLNNPERPRQRWDQATPPRNETTLPRKSPIEGAVLNAWT